MADADHCATSENVDEHEGQGSHQEEGAGDRDGGRVTDVGANSWQIVKQNYTDQTRTWPSRGQHILAQFDDTSVVVYQAFKPSIARYAVEHQRFGGPGYSLSRMTWIKTNFMWMMYRSGWAQKVDQEKVLAVRITKTGFEDILLRAITGDRQKAMKLDKKDVDVRLQWDPDHGPTGDKLERRAVQLGLKGQVLLDYSEKYILNIKDITDFVHEQFHILQKSGQHDFVHEQFHILQKSGQHAIITPQERVYTPSNSKIYCQIGLDERSEQTVVSFGT